jgi:hypothetical protein
MAPEVGFRSFAILAGALTIIVAALIAARRQFVQGG